MIVDLRLSSIELVKHSEENFKAPVYNSQ